MNDIDSLLFKIFEDNVTDLISKTEVLPAVTCNSEVKECFSTEPAFERHMVDTEAFQFCQTQRVSQGCC